MRLLPLDCSLNLKLPETITANKLLKRTCWNYTYYYNTAATALLLHCCYCRTTVILQYYTTLMPQPNCTNSSIIFPKYNFQTTPMIRQQLRNIYKMYYILNILSLDWYQCGKTLCGQCHHASCKKYVKTINVKITLKIGSG